MNAEREPVAAAFVTGIGRLAIDRFMVAQDVSVAHRWLTDPHAFHWGMGDQSLCDTRRYFEAIEGSRTHESWMGFHDGRPAFLAEIYDPTADAVGAYYEPELGDCGLHVLIAPPTVPIHGFTWAVFSLIVDTLFARPDIARLVVEPDVTNNGIHRLNERAGFVYERRIEMPDKTADLAFCTRAGREAARQRHAIDEESV